jgi:hypothetical protein
MRIVLGSLRRIAASATVAAVLALVHCGARSALPAPDVAAEGDAGPPVVAVPCIPGRFPLQKATPAVMFVLDRSTSMREALGRSTQSRWLVLTNSLAATLPNVDQTMQIGALLYPSAGAVRDTCPVPSAPEIALGFDHASTVITRMRSVTPSGATPTADALDAASRAVLGFRAATTARALVLATDGAPNCNAALDPRTCRCAQGTPRNCGNGTRCLDDARTVDRIAQYAARGLPTYVVGLQGSGDNDFDSVLDAMAVAGGRPQNGAAHRYYAASSEGDLTRALTTIQQQVGSCTVLSASVPSDEGSITVTINGVEIPYDETGERGWMWGNKPNGEIVLLEDACARYASTANANLVATVACEEPSDGGNAQGSVTHDG